MKLQLNVLVLMAVFSAAGIARADSVHFDGKELTRALTLKDQQTHTIYENEEQPATCHRTEQDGTEQLCHTEEDRQCRIVNREVCHNEGERHCSPVIRRVCQTTNRRVCDGAHVCHQIPETVCHEENSEECHTTNRQVCQYEPQQECQDFPRQVCVTIPRYIQVPYACTKTVSVPVGTALDYNVTANVAVNFIGAPANVKADELLNVAIAGDDVQLSLEKASNQVLMAVKKTSSMKIVAAQEKVITAQYDITVSTFEEICGGALSSLDNVALNTAGIVSLKLNGTLKQDSLSLHLKVAEKSFASFSTVFDADVEQKNIVFTPTGADQTAVTVDLRAIKSSIPLGFGYYQVDATASCNAPEGLINPDTFRSQNKTATGGKGAWINAH